jgi:hypothetical protein
MRRKSRYTPTSTKKLMIAMPIRKNTETNVPITPPTSINPGKRCCRLLAVRAMISEAANTTVEWPSEKKRPTVIGRLPSCINLRVMLSIAAM